MTSLSGAGMKKRNLSSDCMQLSSIRSIVDYFEEEKRIVIIYTFNEKEALAKSVL